MKKYKTLMVMKMFEEVKFMCEKVDVNPVVLTPVIGDNIIL